MIPTIARKEFHSLFATPSTWLVLGALQFIFAWIFLTRMEAFLEVQAQLAQITNAPGATLAIAAPLYATLALIMLLLVPLFTMRLIAEERRNQTLALLLSAPVSSTQIIAGKFLGLLLFLLLIIVSCTLMVSTLAIGTRLDIGLLLGNALGLVLLSASYAALGLYVSALTAQPLIAALSSLAVLFGLWLVDFSSSGDNAWHALTPTHHFQSLNNGLFNSADVVYFVLMIAVFLLLAARRLHNNRSYS